MMPPTRRHRRLTRPPARRLTGWGRVQTNACGDVAVHGRFGLPGRACSFRRNWFGGVPGGSEAWAIARTTHTRRAPASRSPSSTLSSEDAADGKPRLGLLIWATGAACAAYRTRSRPYRLVVRLGRGGIDRSDAQVVDILVFRTPRSNWPGAVGGTTEDRPAVQVLAGRRGIPRRSVPDAACRLEIGPVSLAESLTQTISLVLHRRICGRSPRASSSASGFMSFCRI